MNNTTVEEAALTGEGLFSERQITRPLLLALLFTGAGYLTFARFYTAQDGLRFPDRYLGNDFCLLIVTVFIAASLYTALQYLGLAVERRQLRLFQGEAGRRPPLYELGCFLSGRRYGAKDGFFARLRDWYDHARSREDFATLVDHLLLLRERQHLHNFTPLTFVIWALPLLGFIGTVIGITRSIGGLEEVVAAAGAPDSGGLKEVLSGLRFAFDTTFMGLILVIPTMLYTLLLRTKAQKLDMCYYEIIVENLFHDIRPPGPEPSADH